MRPQSADAAPFGVENCILPVADLRQNHMRNKPDHEKTSSSQDTRSSAATGQARNPARRTAGVETRHTARKEIELRSSRQQHPAGVEAHRRPGQAFRQREEKTGTEFQPERLGPIIAILGRILGQGGQSQHWRFMPAINRRRRYELTPIGIETLEDVVLDVLMEARNWEPPLGTVEVAYRAGLPAPRERAMADFVLRQLEKSGRVVEVREGRRTVGWRVPSSESLQ